MDSDFPQARRPGGRLARWLRAALLALAAAAALAAPCAAQPDDTDAFLDGARRQMEAIRDGLEDRSDAELLERRAAAQDIQARAQAVADSLAPRLSDVAARLAQLGPPPADAGEAPDLAAQRRQLEKSQADLDGQLKLARLLAVEAGQASDRISALRRTEFQARLGERRPSILSPVFWSEFRQDRPRDLRRLERLGSELADAVAATPPRAWAVVGLAVAALVVLHAWIMRLLLRLTASRVPHGRLRRSVHAWAQVLLWVAIPGLVAECLYLGLRWNTVLTPATDALLSGLVQAACFAGYVAGVGRALLSPDRPSWRLPPLPDALAQRLRHLPLALAGLVVLAWLSERLPVLLNASLTSTMLLSCLAALGLGVAAAAALRGIERVRRRLVRQADPEAPVPPRPLWQAAVAAAIWSVLGASLLCVLIGYVAFGTFVIRQMVWTGVVVASAYLLSVLIEDGFTTLLGAAHREPDALEPRPREQAAVLLSGVARLCVALIALMLLLAPFGEGPSDLLNRAGTLRAGLVVGEFRIRPGTLLQALAVLAASLLMLRVFKQWLAKRYLPTTSLDPGMQVSAVTLFGYAGVVLAVALALSALGIGLERVAWIASALSVGIGFGLQAVVQNFVSGLILLAERPVKVGDWVSLPGVEGDIRRINVRATEIQMGDRSTVIVPNSEFITKTVRNVTHANPMGLVQIKLPMPLDTDAPAVRDIMQAAFSEHPDVLDTPAPSVFLDGVDTGSLVFNATGFVGSPRAAYGVRSALLFDVLERLGRAGIPVARPATMLVRKDAPGD